MSADVNLGLIRRGIGCTVSVRSIGAERSVAPPRPVTGLDAVRRKHPASQFPGPGHWVQCSAVQSDAKLLTGGFGVRRMFLGTLALDADTVAQNETDHFANSRPRALHLGHDDPRFCWRRLHDLPRKSPHLAAARLTSSHELNRMGKGRLRRPLSFMGDRPSQFKPKREQT
jgi:hypothetical protein